MLLAVLTWPGAAIVLQQLQFGVLHVPQPVPVLDGPN